MANPIISRAELVISSTPMTIQGWHKTAFLLALTTLSGIGFLVIACCQAALFGFINIAALSSIVIGFVLSLVIISKPLHSLKSLAVPYAPLKAWLLGDFVICGY